MEETLQEKMQSIKSLPRPELDVGEMRRASEAGIPATDLREVSKLSDKPGMNSIAAILISFVVGLFIISSGLWTVLAAGLFVILMIVGPFILFIIGFTIVSGVTKTF